MIIINVINWVVDILAGFSFDFEFNGGVVNTVIGIINFIAYVLPMGAIVRIIIATFTLMTWRITVSLIKTLWDLIPIA